VNNVKERQKIFGILLAAVFAMLSFGAFAGEKRIAIQGYDPVAYFTLEKPVMGDPKYQYDFDGEIYQFSKAEHLEMFRQDPDHFAPVFRGLCTSALSHGFAVEADPHHWIIHDGQLHIFAGPVEPSDGDQDEMVVKARENWEKLGKPRLTQVTTQ
jgi:YHS domain-containing protein